MRFLALFFLAIACVAAEQGFILRSLNKNKEYEFGTQYAAVVYQLIIPSGDYFVQGLDAMNRDGKGPDDVLSLHIAGQDVEFLPHKYLEWYKNINHLHIAGSGLTTLENEQLDGRIRYLHLDGNRIESIPVDFFRNSKDMELLSMERNRITKLDSDLFTGMTKLRYISFAGNRLRTLPGDLFRNNLNIIRMSFENNALISVGTDLVSHLTKLKTVSFDGNVCINSVYLNEDRITEKLTTELTKNCSGKCGTVAKSQNTIESLMDRLGEFERSDRKWNDQSSESNESNETGDHDDQEKKPCPYAHYQPMNRN